MIRVTIELHPGGDARRARHLGTIDIWNDLSSRNLKTLGNYGYRFSRRGQPGSEWRTGAISGFPRKRLGAYDLLLRVLQEAVGDRN